MGIRQVFTYEGMGKNAVVTVNGGTSVADIGTADVTSIKVEGDKTSLEYVMEKTFVYGLVNG